MQIPSKRLKSGLELPVYGLGTWRIGGATTADYSDDNGAVKSIRSALELGITHIDTAELYGGGHTEEIIGEAIAGFDRSKLIITSKVSGWHQSYSQLKKACENSLKRLGTDYLDLYLLHSYPEIGIPIADTMKAMDELVGSGLVRHIGVSNMTPRRVDEAQYYSRNPIVCNQVHYNVQCREAEDWGIPEQCQQKDMFLIAWRPLQKGLLPKSLLMDSLVEKYQKTYTQIALNWLVAQPNVIVISKTSRLEHLQENLGALDWQMTDEDIELVRREFPDQQAISDVLRLDYKADVEP